MTYVVLALTGLLALPAAALSASGGSGLDPSGGMGAPSNPGSPAVQSGTSPVTATSNGITLTTNGSALLRNTLGFTGSAPAGSAGQTLEIERLGHETNWQWTPTSQATINSDGTFSTTWTTNHIGRFLIRAVVGGTSASAAGASGAPTVATTIYRPSIATLYGPGFFGRETACGPRLTRSTIGLANRTLRCGSLVAVYYRGRTLSVPVIDRGPYANGADWDLTMATGKALGITGTVHIGAVSLPKAPPSAPTAPAQ
jgi:rare lipoprotein A